MGTAEVEYIKALAHELAMLAVARDLRTLAYLLSMAEHEAEAILVAQRAS